MVSHQLRICIGALCAIILVGSSTFAQDSKTEITRNDLALSLMRLETALKDSDLSDEETARVNKAFDQATLQFFQRQYGPAIRGINDTTVSVQPDEQSQEAKTYYSLRTKIEPLVFVRGTRVQPVLTIESLYPDPLDGEEKTISGNLVFKHKKGGINFRIPYELSVGPEKNINMEIPITADKNHFVPHQYQIAFEAESGTHYDSSIWTVVPKSLDVISAENRDKFSNIRLGEFQIEQAITTALERNKLINDKPSLEKSSEFLIDPNTLVQEVGEEIRQLARKTDQTNPYKKRRGDYWRVLGIKAKDPVPLRVYLPESANSNEPIPLVIAFHGAGGDENMFMDAYGVGRIKELADQHGFLLVTPLTYAFNGETMGPYFDLLMKVIGNDYSVDENRVYVLGHSMGGGATANLTAIRGDKLAAVAPLCGYRAITSAPEKTPPILAYAAELDPLARPAQVEAAVAQTREAGNEVEYRLMKNWGHTLVVGKILPDVIEWLLQHKR